MAFGTFIHPSFLAYALPLIAFLTLDNLFIARRRHYSASISISSDSPSSDTDGEQHKQQKQQQPSVAQLTMKSSWLSMFVLLSFLLVFASLSWVDSLLYVRAGLMRDNDGDGIVIAPLEFLIPELRRWFGNPVASIDESDGDPWFLHCLVHVNLLFGPLFACVCVYVSEYGVSALFSTALYSDILAVRGLTKTFVIGRTRLGFSEKVCLSSFNPSIHPFTCIFMCLCMCV